MRLALLQPNTDWAQYSPSSQETVFGTKIPQHKVEVTMTEDWRAQYDERVLISIVSVHRTTTDGWITLNSERPIQTNTSSRLHLIYNYTWLNDSMVTLTEFILLIKFIRLHGFGGTHYVTNNTNVTIKCTENYTMIGCYLASRSRI